MPVINRIADYAEEMTAWRRHLHENPELTFECHKTAAFVIDRLKGFGITDIHPGIAKTGIVAIIEGQGEGPTIGLRADMDALPMDEITGLDYASKTPGAMHACGHDGHTTMLLGAAKYLAETRRFRGRVALIFQPAEEYGGGGEVMVDEGIMDRFGISRVFALHNAPGEPEGHMLMTPGPIMAAVDTFYIDVQGKGGHGAMPHQTADPIMAMTGIVQALQTIVSRNHDTREKLVVSVTQVHAGSADNVIPDAGRIVGTVRTFRPEEQTLVQDRMAAIVAGQAAAYGVTATLTYDVGYPATVNETASTAFAAEVARDVVGAARVDDDTAPVMGAEDFAYMLNARPGAYVFLGQGDGPSVHHPAYDFNDAIAPIGASFFARLVERAQPLDAV